MKAWLDGLDPRERTIVIAGGVLAVIIVVWGLVWTPLVRGAAAYETSVAEKQQLLTDLSLAQQLAPGAAPAPSRGSQSLVVLIDNTATEHGLPAFTRTRPDGPNGISVSFQDAPFDGLLRWLIALQREHGIDVQSASFNGTRQRGLVSGQLFLSR